MTGKTRILFVCLGNIIRSPLAEHMFAHEVKLAGVGDKYEVESAGTSSYHIGESPDTRMRSVASEYGLVYEGLARQFSPIDFGRFDLIIAMDMSNKSDILNLASDPVEEEKVYTLRAFDPEGNSTDAVPDPYYSGIDGFHLTYKIVERSCQKLLAALESGELEV